ncbi:GDSL-type esterase/lipase family protein [Armatimonas rosea]|uniref:Lysophospholipase L1-like esterase n=1 Tax=Armatimonas rosea TaxID=685828 RepID=A0A7W9W791_ARMRO|nr:lysophospholipase L1-like esterase [Armatimonas rosea]
MEYFEPEVRLLEPRTRLAGSNSIVFYGSSSVRLWTTLQSDIAPLTEAPHPPILNLGFGGSTLAACVHYFDRLPGRVIKEHGPLRSLVVYAGENDLGDGASVDQVVDSFFWLHAMVRDRLGETPFVFLSIKPSPARAPILEKIRQANARIATLIPSRPQSQFVDVYASMVDSDGKPRAELWCDDGIHLSAAGYALWTQLLAVHQVRLFR